MEDHPTDRRGRRPVTAVRPRRALQDAALGGAPLRMNHAPCMHVHVPPPSTLKYLAGTFEAEVARPSLA